MIRFPKLVEYFKHEITNSEGAIRNIFLSNAENQILATAAAGYEEASILSTLFNDSIFIIRLNLLNGEQPPKNQKPLEINLSMGDKQAYIFFIKNLFILGVIVQDKLKAVGHKMSKDMLKFVEDELQNVVQWTQNNDVY